MARRVVLDTHAWIWLITGNVREMPAEVVRRVLTADEQWICSASVYELHVLVARSRVQLHLPVDEWVQEATVGAGIRVCPLTALDAAAAGNLQASWQHGDPLDRMILATAQRRRATLVTRDKQLLQFRPDLASW